jgi:hypothetical protein
MDNTKKIPRPVVRAAASDSIGENGLYTAPGSTSKHLCKEEVPVRVTLVVETLAWCLTDFDSELLVIRAAELLHFWRAGAAVCGWGHCGGGRRNERQGRERSLYG